MLLLMQWMDTDKINYFRIILLHQKTHSILTFTYKMSTQFESLRYLFRFRLVGVLFRLDTANLPAFARRS